MDKKSLQIESVFLEGVLEQLSDLQKLVEDRYTTVEYELSEFAAVDAEMAEVEF